jgi:hypothetical protein
MCAGDPFRGTGSGYSQRAPDRHFPCRVGSLEPEKQGTFCLALDRYERSGRAVLSHQAAAIAHVHKLREKGIRNIAVGCMQINLKYHPNAFDDLESALDPKTNVRYAAKLLNTLFDAHKSWGESIRRYHSSNPKFNRPYHDKVVRQWNSSRQVTAAEHRRRVIAAHRAQREKWRNERAAQIADARAAAQCELAAHCRRTAGPHRTEHHPHSSAPKRHRARILCACQLDGSRTSNGAHVDRRIL